MNLPVPTSLPNLEWSSKYFEVILLLQKYFHCFDTCFLHLTVLTSEGMERNKLEFSPWEKE